MIAIASDHAGVAVKAEVLRQLQGMGFEVEDLGPPDPASVDYPDYAHLLAGAVADGRIERGVLICGTGIGMSMTANRHRGVRAALCHDAYTAEMSRRHNDANVLCVGARSSGAGVIGQIVEVFMTTDFEGERHQRRVAKIEREET